MTTPHSQTLTPARLPVAPLRCRGACSQGFTLIELLVVIIIVTASLAVIVPAFSVMTKSSRVEAGINTISASISAARILSHRFRETDKGGIGSNPTNADYSGTAVIFCPGGDIRFVINDQTAYANTGTPGGVNDTNYIENFATPSNGYKDIAGIDYAKLPNGSGVVGVRRDSGGVLQFLPPPFAIRFNELGQMAADQSILYYDSDFNGGFNQATAPVTSTRDATTYNPQDWLPKRNGSSAKLNPGFKRYTLPFERIETVNAILLYDENKFFTEGYRWPNTVPAGGVPIDQWLTTNGRALYFSPYTGLVIPESIQ